MTQRETTWLDTEQAAARCGLKRSRFNELVRDCRIPHGGSSERRRRFDALVIDDFIRRGFPRPQAVPTPRARRVGPPLRQVIEKLDPGLARLLDKHGSATEPLRTTPA